MDRSVKSFTRPCRAVVAWKTASCGPSNASGPCWGSCPSSPSGFCRSARRHAGPRQATSDAPDAAVAGHRLEIPPTAITRRRDVQRGVARLGGFLVHKGDGEPGWPTLWFGFERLFLRMLGAQLASALPPPERGERQGL
ncbi:IS4 family transposase [Azospirillum sp. A1-3]|uniref:IS4 family transposase n=1 Tax=Azospirillum sp. A1-3 TaxID=185874 RepID=UPI00336C29E5